MSTMIEVRDLTFAYPAQEEEQQQGTVALRNVDLTIEKGSFVAVLGHNGSGKSTLAKHMNAVLLPSGGRVFVAGMDTLDEQQIIAIRRAVGMVFQNPDNQIVANVVEEDVAFGPENLGVPSADIRRRVDEALAAVEVFLPHIDNWATCDMFCPKALKKQPERLLHSIRGWLKSDRVYTVRYGLVRLTFWYLEEPVFSSDVLELAAAVKQEDYYVQMAVAWLFSMALVKQWEATLPYLQAERLSPWIHNKAIQKAIESYQLTPAQKEFLKALKRKKIS